MQRFVVILMALSVSWMFLGGCSAPIPAATAPSPSAMVARSTAVTVTPTASPTPSPASPTAPPDVTATPQGAAVAALEVAIPGAGAQTVAAQTPVEVAVVLRGVRNLYGAQVRLFFDPAILQVQDQDEALPGVQLTPGEAFAPAARFIALNSADNVQGTIDYAVTLLGHTAPLEGDLVLARFLVLLSGTAANNAETTKILFGRVILANAEGQALPVVSEDLVLQVKP